MDTSAPLVSVTKEVPEIGITNNDFNVAPAGSNFELHNTAYSTSLTPSDSTSSGTFTLGTGSFDASDVGKRIVGNGGEAILTATDGSYTLISSFNDTSAIAAGDWSMFALEIRSDGDLGDIGITLSGITSQIIYPVDQYTTAITSASIDTEFWTDINSITADEAVNDLDSKVGVRDYFSDNSGVAAYNFDGNINDIGGNYNGTWVGTERYIEGEYGQAIGFDGFSYVQINNSFGTLFNYNSRYTISFWLIDTDEICFNFGNSNGNTGISLRRTTADPGGRLYIAKPDDGDGNRFLYDIPDGYQAGDLFTLVKVGDEAFDFYRNGVFLESWSPGSTGVANNGDNTIGSGIGQSPSSGGYDQFRIFNRSLSSSEVADLYGEVAETLDSTNSNDEIYYALSNDDRTTWKIIDDTNGERPIVRNNSGTWEHNINTTYGFVSWASALINDEFSALNEAMENSTNHMNSAQLNAVTDSNHFTLGNDFDLSISMYLSDGNTRIPSSDGISINYDGNVISQGAVLGTDYTYNYPDSNTLQFNALSTENFKIRVI